MKCWITLPKGSTIFASLDYYQFMTELYSASSSVSPLTAILWCFYPVAILVIIELLLGGGFDDDNDDQDGGMLIPAYSRSNVWNYFKLSIIKFKRSSENWITLPRVSTIVVSLD